MPSRSLRYLRTAEITKLEKIETIETDEDHVFEKPFFGLKMDDGLIIELPMFGVNLIFMFGQLLSVKFFLQMRVFRTILTLK